MLETHHKIKNFPLMKILFLNLSVAIQNYDSLNCVTFNIDLLSIPFPMQIANQICSQSHAKELV